MGIHASQIPADRSRLSESTTMTHGRHSTTFAILTTTAFAFGCGRPSDIILEVRSDLLIPDEVDSLPFSLSSGQHFPLDVEVRPTDSTPHELDALVEGQRADVAVARSRGRFVWNEGVATRVSLPPMTPGNASP